ncbi:MAG: signal peptidase II [Ruminococcus sp.]|nr:signal peptidase II [Ruminococcus sp.]MBQ9139266.1 signal peptidase II [Ruminococcus sp.]
MIILLIAAIIVLIGADQLVKYWAVENLKPVGNMDFIRIGDLEILDLTYLENNGAIFGSMAGQRWFLVGLTSLLVAGAAVFMFYIAKKSRFFAVISALFVAGGVGNLIDRIRFGYVVDMFDIQLFDFAVFNVADICVTVAEAMMIYYIIFVELRKEMAKKKAEKASAEVTENE